MRTGPTKKTLNIYTHFDEILDPQNFAPDCWNPACALRIKIKEIIVVEGRQ